MTKYLFLLIVLAVGLYAKEVSSEKPRFKIYFPDATGWSPVDCQSSGTEVQIWSAENHTLALVLNFTVVDAPMPEAKPTFKENAEEWSRGMMQRFSRKISSRFTTLAGWDACELVASLKNGDEELFFSNWMIQAGDVTYGVTIIAKDSPNLTGDVVLAFLKSLEIPK
jgi:hypothetical protein